MFINSYLSSLLDFFRWFGAFLVLISHLRSIVFVDYNNLNNHNIFIKFFYFITGFGHQAVIIFFVLSGFLVGGSIINRLKTNNFSFKKYFINRFSRLYIVVPIALIIGYLFDKIGFMYFNQSGLYTNGIYLASINYDISTRLNPLILISNFFMLQTIITPTFGSNVPLWSLANEFWYYILFPLIILVLTARSYRNKLIALVLCILVSFFISGANKNGNMLLYFSIWLLGTFVWFIKKPIFKRIYMPTILMLFISVISRLGIFDFLNIFHKDLLLSISFCLIINTAMYHTKKQANILNFKNINKFMASFSFSLYLMHWPLIVFIISIISFNQNLGLKMQPNFLSSTIFMIILIIIYLYSFLIAMLTEYNTHTLRNTLNNILAIKT